MKDSNQTKEQLLAELVSLRTRLNQLEHKQLGAKKVEEALASAHRRLNHLLSASPAIIYSCQTHGEYAATYVSDNIERILGYTPAQFAREPNFWLKHIHADDQKRVLDKLHLLGEKHTHTYEYRFRCADGTYRWIYDEMQLIRDDREQPIEMVGSMIDITDLKQVEEELRGARKEWENIFQGIGQSAIILDEHYTIQEVNHATVQALGRPAQELIGKKCYEIFHGNDAPPGGCPLATILQSGHLETVEMEIEAFNGVFLVSCTPIVDERGNLQKIIHIATDVTDRKRAEEDLRQERDFNKRLIQASPAFIVSISPEGKTLMMSNAMLEALGYTSDEVTGKDYLSTFVPQADRELLGGVFGQLIDQNESTVNENRVVAKDGRELMVLWHGRQVLDECGNVEYFFGIGIDITERKRVEEALRFTQFSIDRTTEAAFWVGPDAHFVYVNEAACQSLGFTREELLTMTVHDIDPGMSPEAWAVHWQDLKARRSFTLTSCHRKRTGEMFPVEITVNYLEYQGQEYNFAIARDITERKRAEEDLRKSEFFLRETQKIARVGGWKANPETDFLAWTEGVYDIIEVPLDYKPGLKEGLKYYLPEYFPVLQKRIQRSYTHGEPFVEECEVMTESGKRLWTEVRGVARVVEDKTAYVYGTFQDITVRKRAEESVRMAEVGKLASGLVHEVRNPLNAMRMQIAVIRNKLGAPDSQNLDMAVTQLERLEHEVLRVQELANDFLSYGRPASDRPETIELTRVVIDIAEFIRPEFEQNSVHVQVLCDKDLGELTVRMDLSKLRQVLLNLAENSRQALQRGGQLSFICDRPSDREVRIQVQDTGCGIMAEQLPRIFDAFYSTKDEGTGLGLAIVKRTIEAVGGYVKVTSEVDQGTCFELYLPLVQDGSFDRPGAEIKH